MSVHDGLNFVDGGGEFLCVGFYSGRGGVCSIEGVKEISGAFESIFIQEMWVRCIPWDGMIRSGFGMRVWSELDRDGGKEVIFWDVVERRRLLQGCDGGLEAGNTGVVVGGEVGDERLKDRGFIGERNEGGRGEDVVNMGTVDGGGDGVWARMSNGKSRVKGVWRAEKKMKD